MFRLYLKGLVGIVPLFKWINRLLLYGLAIFRARLSENLIKYTLINLRRGARYKDQLLNSVNSSFPQYPVISIAGKLKLIMKILAYRAVYIQLITITTSIRYTE